MFIWRQSCTIQPACSSWRSICCRAFCSGFCSGVVRRNLVELPKPAAGGGNYDMFGGEMPADDEMQEWCPVIGSVVGVFRALTSYATCSFLRDSPSFIRRPALLGFECKSAFTIISTTSALTAFPNAEKAWLIVAGR